MTAANPEAQVGLTQGLRQSVGPEADRISPPVTITVEAEARRHRGPQRALGGEAGSPGTATGLSRPARMCRGPAAAGGSASPEEEIPIPVRKSPDRRRGQEHLSGSLRMPERHEGGSAEYLDTTFQVSNLRPAEP